MIHQPIDARHHDAAKAVLAWYERHGRILPWRVRSGESADPYAVWLSEIMLQQTTVATVKGYFAAFMSRWPDVEALAAASREDVLAAWAGLGYYARARNLHAAAIEIADNYGGKFPTTEAGLRQLPGIGGYTAAAVAAIAFGRRAVVVDGNIERVAARWQAVTTPLPKAKPELRAVMDALTPEHDAGDFAQAMMDIGALICTPSRKVAPDCGCCPLKATCLGRHGDAARLPLKLPKKARPSRHGVVAVMRDRRGRVLLEQRPERGLLGGMLVFPGSDWASGSPLQQDYPIGEDMAVAVLLAAAESRCCLAAEVEHIFTHFRLTLTIEAAVMSDDIDLPPRHRWVEAAGLAAVALPTVMRKVAIAAGLL